MGWVLKRVLFRACPGHPLTRATTQHHRRSSQPRLGRAVEKEISQNKLEINTGEDYARGYNWDKTGRRSTNVRININHSDLLRLGNACMVERFRVDSSVGV